MESFEMCWGRMEKVGWTDRVRNEVRLHSIRRVKEERNIPQTLNRRKANWIGHILRRNCLLKHGTEGKIEGRIEVTGRRGRSRKQLLDGLKKKRGCWKLKEKAPYRSRWRARFGRGAGPVVSQNTGDEPGAWSRYFRTSALVISNLCSCTDNPLTGNRSYTVLTGMGGWVGDWSGYI
jgi:hypothetical protein